MSIEEIDRVYRSDTHAFHDKHNTCPISRERLAVFLPVGISISAATLDWAGRTCLHHLLLLHSIEKKKPKKPSFGINFRFVQTQEENFTTHSSVCILEIVLLGRLNGWDWLVLFGLGGLTGPSVFYLWAVCSSWESIRWEN